MIYHNHFLIYFIKVSISDFYIGENYGVLGYGILLMLQILYQLFIITDVTVDVNRKKN